MTALISAKRESYGVWLIMLLITVDSGFGLQIPCLQEFDKSCSIVPYSYCDADKKQCICLPRFKEIENRCIPELNSFCENPGQPCFGLANAVCSASYRCICETGFENQNESCVRAFDAKNTEFIDQLSSFIPPQLIKDTNSFVGDNNNFDFNNQQSDNSEPDQQAVNDANNFSGFGSKDFNNNDNYNIFNNHQSHKPPSPNDLDIQWNANIVKNQRKELIRRILENANLRKLLLQHILGQKGVANNMENQNGFNGVNSVSNGNDGKGQQQTVGLQIPNENIGSSKMEGLRQQCQATSQCSVVVPHSVCFRGTCQCGPNFIENNGNCFPGLEKPCSANQPCFTRYSTCGESGFCKCKTGFRKSGDQCVPGIGSECLHRGQPCFGVPDSFCNNKDVCACRPGFEEKDGHCERYQAAPAPGARCSTDCDSLSHSYCNSTGQCACLPGYNEQDGKCKRIGRPGAVCYSSNDCSAQDPNTWCNQNECVCVRGYNLLLGKCYPSLGSRCSMAMPCGVSNSYCSSLGICQCKENAIQRGEKCIRLRKVFDEALAVEKPESSKQCAIIGSPCVDKANTVCTLDLKCACRLGFTKTDNGDCVSDSGDQGSQPMHQLPWLESAESAFELSAQHSEPQKLVLEETSCNEVGRPCVGIQNSLCTGDGICICVPGHVKTVSGCKSMEHFVRFTPQPNLNDMPVSPACNTACDEDVNAVCTPMGKCACKQGYTRSQGSCFPALGTACTKEDWCATPNTYCSPNGMCSCSYGYMRHRNQCKPLEELDSYGKSKNLECWVPGKPCLAVKNAVCNKSYQCECLEGFHRHGDGSCMDMAHHIEMSQNSPRCLQGFVRVSGHCLPGVLLGYSCHDSKQCSEVTPGSLCENGKCSCEKGYTTFNATTCLAVRPLENACSVSEECSTPESSCTEERCQCRPGYIPLFGLCFAGLGQQCSDLSENASLKCGVRNSVCIDNVCKCSNIQYQNVCI